MAVLEALRPTQRTLVMELVAEAGLDVSDWANYNGRIPAANPKYCYEWAFSQRGRPAVACLWFGNLKQRADGSIFQTLNLWNVAKRHESLPGRGMVAKRARALDMVLQDSVRTRAPIRVIVVDGDQADLEAQNKVSSRVQHRMLDPSPWHVTDYDWTTGDCTLERADKLTEGIDGGAAPGRPQGGLPAPSPDSRRTRSTGAGRAARVPTYLARLAFNSQGWRRPATAAEVEEAGHSYRSEHGFGHEDWLLREEWEIDGWRYGFVQGVNSSRNKLLEQATPFNLVLFTIPGPGLRRKVAEVLDVECLDDAKAVAAVRDFTRLGWLDTMRDEIVAAGGRPEALDDITYAPHILNIRFRARNVVTAHAGALLPDDDPVHRIKRYSLCAYPLATADGKQPEQSADRAGQGTVGYATANDYMATLKALEDESALLGWLVDHYYMPGATASMQVIAQERGFADYRAANLQYGRLARMIAESLSRDPAGIGDDGYLDWMGAIATLVDRDAHGHSQWRLRDEVVEAMVALGWVDRRDDREEQPPGLDIPSDDERRVAKEYGLADTEVRQMMLSRRGQGQFRMDTLRYWGCRCAVTGLPADAFLVASHIKPWKHSNPKERLDRFNGLPLIPNLDKAFDRGYVSFRDDGTIMISPLMSREMLDALGIRPGMSLRNHDPRINAYLAYHRKHIFKDGEQAREPQSPNGN